MVDHPKTAIYNYIAQNQDKTGSVSIHINSIDYEHIAKVSDNTNIFTCIIKCIVDKKHYTIVSDKFLSKKDANRDAFNTVYNLLQEKIAEPALKDQKRIRYNSNRRRSRSRSRSRSRRRNTPRIRTESDNDSATEVDSDSESFTGERELNTIKRNKSLNKSIDDMNDNRSNKKNRSNSVSCKENPIKSDMCDSDNINSDKSDKLTSDKSESRIIDLQISDLINLNQYSSEPKDLSTILEPKKKIKTEWKEDFTNIDMRNYVVIIIDYENICKQSEITKLANYINNVVENRKNEINAKIIKIAGFCSNVKNGADIIVRSNRSDAVDHYISYLIGKLESNVNPPKKIYIISRDKFGSCLQDFCNNVDHCADVNDFIACFC